MGLLVSSFVFHSSLLTAKGVDLVVLVMASFAQWKSSVFFFDYRGAFQTVFDSYCNRLNLADNEA